MMPLKTQPNRRMTPKRRNFQADTTQDKGAPRLPKGVSDMEPKLRFKGKGRGLIPEMDESHLPRATPNYSPYRNPTSPKGYIETDEHRMLKQGFRKA